MTKKRFCPVCETEKPLNEFIKYARAHSYSVKCKACTAPKKEIEIYKDGKLNTKQVKGFNWLLGYTLTPS